MLYERTAVSKLPEETIANEIAELRDDKKMSLDMFYRDPYVLDFLGLKDTYSEKDLEKLFCLNWKNSFWKWVQILRFWHVRNTSF